MAYIMPAKDGVITMKSSANLTSNQYHVVSVDTTSATDIACKAGLATGDQILGVLLNKPDDGEEAEIFVGPGICPCVVGTAGVTQSAPVNCETGGEIEDSANNEPVLGTALETRTSGQIAMVMINGISHCSAVASWNA